ncbi:MAG: hypothetical protein PCFJNLEI_00536 [Verrucomicrobiae bacterium]|nr:hypothetical protein [Verrucomicrobiae bacterium]
MKRALFLILVTALAGLNARAHSNSPPRDISAAVTKGVDFFRAQAVTNEEGWLCHPIPGSRVARYETKAIRYKKVEITIPGRTYEPYEVLVPGASAGEPMRRETRQRAVGFDPSKDRKETRIVDDPNGPLVRDVQVPVYERDAGRRWRYGGLGNNGLAILALRRCGVRGDDPLVVTPAQNLANIVNLYGLPDHLHDLAGLVAGFAVLPGEEYKKLTEMCASKLMDAQIVSGPATGLWGPVAVSTPMVSAYLKTMMRLGDDRKALQLSLQAEQQKKTSSGKPTGKVKSLEEDIRRLDTQLQELQSDANRVTQLAFKMFDALGQAKHLGLILLRHQEQSLGIEALPYVIQNQISADLDSTALAIFALRIAFENGRLPAKTWRPDPPKPAGPGVPSLVVNFPAPRTSADVLALATKAIAAARKADGLWPEVNIHQPVSDFVWLKSIPQIKPEAFPKLRQPVTLASTVAGAASLANIAMMQSGKPRPSALEHPVCQPLLKDMLQGKVLANTNDVVRTPFDVLLQSTALCTARGKSLRSDFTTWNEIAGWLADKQNPSGSWGRIRRYVLMPGTSLAALDEVLPPIQIADVPTIYDKPHLSMAFSQLPASYNAHYGEYEESYFTIAALLFLADGLPEGWSPTGMQ